MTPVAGATTPPEVAWTYAAGDSNIDRAYAAVETSDGVVFAGRKTDSSNVANIWLVKLSRQSSTTEVVWDRTYGPGTAVDMVETGDGFVVVSSTNGGSDVLLVKVAADGTELWRQAYDAGESRREVPSTLVRTADGGFAVAGRSFTGLASTNDAFLLRTDANGNFPQFDRYASSGIEVVEDLVQASDGGFVLAGRETVSGIGRGLLLKTDAAGNQVWVRVFGDPGQLVFGVELAPNGYALTTADGFVLSDANGFTQAPVPYASGLRPRDIVATPDGGYVLPGSTIANEHLLLKVDSAGNEQWRKTVAPATGGGAAYSVDLTADGGFLLAGDAYDPAASTQAFVVRLHPAAAVADDRFEENDVQADATFIVTNTYENLIARDGDPDWYVFTVPDGKSVYLEVTTDPSQGDLEYRFQGEGMLQVLQPNTVYRFTTADASHPDVGPIAPGTYYLRVAGVPTGSAIDYDLSLVVGNFAPVGGFTVTPQFVPQYDASVTFDGTQSFDYDGSITSYAWDFDSDGTVDANGPTASHVYGAPGGYLATLTVFDGAGAGRTVSNPVFVGNAPPTAAFVPVPTSPVAGEPFDLDGSASTDPEGEIADYAWDIGADGSVEVNGPSPIFDDLSVSGAANLPVELTVTDRFGASSSVIVFVQVKEISVTSSGDTTTATVTNAPADEPTEITIAQSVSGDTTLDSLSVTTNTDASYTLDVSVSETAPTGVTPPPGVFEVGYVTVTTTGIDDSDISEASFTMTIEKNALTTAGIDISGVGIGDTVPEVQLFRLDDATGTWTGYPGVVVAESALGLTFQFDVPGFSEFAIGLLVPDFDVTGATVTSQEPIRVGHDVSVEATVTNDGAAGTRTVQLLADGAPVASEILALGVDETAAISLTHAFDTPGDYTLEVAIAEEDDTPVSAGTVTVRQIVAIDVKPDDDGENEESPINLKSKGRIPVVIYSDADFDATAIDVATVRFGPAEVPSLKTSVEDVNGDGDTDLVVFFDQETAGFAAGDATATLTGETTNGTPFVGTDAITIVGE